MLKSQIKRCVGVGIALLLYSTMQSQDVFVSNPMLDRLHLGGTTQPISTTLEASLLKRSRWSGLYPYQTSVATIRFGRLKPTFQNGRIAKHQFGLRLSNDSWAKSDIRMNALRLSYATAFSTGTKSVLLLGFSVHTSGLRSGINDWLWGSQYVQGTVQNSGGESVQSASQTVGSFSTSAGWQIAGKSRNSGANMFFIGFSANQIASIDIGSHAHDHSLLHATRFIVSSQAEFHSKKGRLSWQPFFVVARQGAFVSNYAGLDAQFLFRKEKQGFNPSKAIALATGLALRSQDAVVLRSSFSYDSYRLFFSYDFNISTLQKTATQLGSFEVGLQFGLF